MVIDPSTLPLAGLEGFYWVARMGGYAKAARAFPYPITQPGVFAQVRKLEQAVGFKLFARVAKDEMVPTREGRALFEFCAPFLERLPNVVRSLRAADAGGELRIDAGSLETITVLPAWIRRLRRRRPEIRVRVQEVSAPEYGRLLTGEADMVVEVQPELPRGVERRTVGTHHAFLVVPEGHRLAKKKGLVPRDLQGEPFVAFDAAARQHAMQLGPLDAAGVEVDVVASASSNTALVALVAARLGVSIVVWPGTPLPTREVRWIPLRGAGMSFAIDAAFRAGMAADPIVGAALACASAERAGSRGRRR